jgi:hypothetical protein
MLQSVRYTWRLASWLAEVTQLGLQPVASSPPTVPSSAARQLEAAAQMRGYSHTAPT